MEGQRHRADTPHEYPYQYGLICATLALCSLQSAAASESPPNPSAPTEQSAAIEFVTKPGWALMKKTIVRSPDGEHHAYLLSDERGLLRMLIHDGREVKQAPEIGRPVFSPDSTRLAAFIQREEKWSLYVDGVVTACPPPVGPPVFSPDSKRIAYWSRNGKRSFLVLDGQVQTVYDAVQRDSLTFDPKTGRPGYLAQLDGRWLIVSGDQEQPIEGEPDGVLVFDEDTDRFVLRQTPIEDASDAVAEVDNQ